MAALNPGTTAPDFALPTMDGKRFSLPEALSRGPVVAAFFKISCPICQYAFPFLERIYKAYGKKNVSIIGISQNNKKDTAGTGSPTFRQFFGARRTAKLRSPA